VTVTVPSTSETAHRPILILGANGSGTTLLRLMLDSHERIAIPQETGFLRLAMAHEWVPYWALGDQWHHHLGMTDDDLISELARFYGGLFASYAESQGKQRWGDKTPFHVWHLELAARMFPDLQVIGIVRHPGAVVSSLRRRFRRPVPRATRHWKRSTTVLIQQAVTLGNRCVVLRYEDLVLKPEATMRPLLEWLGEPWSDRVLSHHEVRRPEGTANEVEGFTRTDNPIDPIHVDDWERHLRGKALQRVVAKTGDLAAFLGYDPEHAMPAEPLNEDQRRPFLTGDDLGRRQRERGAIDWTKRPRPRHEDRPLRPPAPRRRNLRASDLDDVKIGELLRHRAIAWFSQRLSADARRRANDLRRTKPKLDRFLGPR
jgi:hypothetical protein